MPGWRKIWLGVSGNFLSVNLISVLIQIQSNKLRLEDIDSKTAEGFPKLVDGVGNMEEKEWKIPPGPGQGGVEKVVLDDSLKSKVSAAISEYGFNMVASESISLDRYPADLRHEGPVFSIF